MGNYMHKKEGGRINKDLSPVVPRRKRIIFEKEHKEKNNKLKDYLRTSNANGHK